ncbi:MAG: hypothetical protein CL607_03765 [Anaerolineaceae bacterium]|nr:hypothetical protein [Anaerolineaceae bacterium]
MSLGRASGDGYAIKVIQHTHKDLFMATFTSKTAFLDAILKAYDKLEKSYASLSAEDMTTPGACDDWSVKDILAHVYEWQQMVLRWYAAGERGEVPKTPADDLKWNETPILNERIYQTYRDHDLDDIQRLFKASHESMLALLQTIDDDALFTPAHYAWTKKLNFASYMKSATSSHYDWASKLIRKWAKQRTTESM